MKMTDWYWVQTVNLFVSFFSERFPKNRFGKKSVRRIIFHHSAPPTSTKQGYRFPKILSDDRNWCLRQPTHYPELCYSSPLQFHLYSRALFLVRESLVVWIKQGNNPRVDERRRWSLIKGALTIHGRPWKFLRAPFAEKTKLIFFLYVILIST